MPGAVITVHQERVPPVYAFRHVLQDVQIFDLIPIDVVDDALYLITRRFHDTANAALHVRGIPAEFNMVVG